MRLRPKREKSENGNRVWGTSTLKEKFSSFVRKALLMGGTAFIQKPCNSYKRTNLIILEFSHDLFESQLSEKNKSKDWRSWKLHWWRDLDILGLIDGHHPFTWQSCFYVIETALENRAERKKNSFFFTQGFLPIRLKFNGSSHIWLVFSNLTSLQFSWANAVTCNWQLPIELDLFIFRIDI